MIWEPSTRLTIRTQKRPSNISGAGDGLFALEPASRGQWLGMGFPNEALALDAQGALQLPLPQRHYVWRHVERLCFQSDPQADYAIVYANHSRDPNVLWHIGCLFARKDIAVGDELSIDYAVLNDPSWTDHVRGDDGELDEVVGLEWRAALRKTASELLALLDGAPLPAQDVGEH